MRIGLIAPPWVPVPPPAYGGTEVVIDNLARGLQDLGHEVRLFTVGESECPVPTDFLYPQPMAPIGSVIPETAHVLAAYKSLADMDIIHDHTFLGPLISGLRGMPRPPVVTTNHGPCSRVTVPVLQEAARHASTIAISYSQARQARENGGVVPVAAVIHHGIDLDLYKPGPGGGGYLMFIGRMSADKGVHHAVRVAKQAGKKLVVSTKMREEAEIEYFEKEVRPLLDPGDEVPSEIPQRQRIELLRHADALLNPITWCEPFGLVMAEALACATPVLAFDNGAAGEIIDSGRTGYLCRDEAEMIAAIDRVGGIDRDQCRESAERRFSLQRMARDHDRIYRRLLETEGGFLRRVPAASRRLVSA
ncbi:MAG TPA: glycosyltransferase family 4 protein [Streptosporangiaceae bacterium]|nr:glycosyltransferase family 4 protein [Streptosporangiaceae bacterium]